MFQNIIILLLFAAAMSYLLRMIYRSFLAKSCGTGCGKCSAVDFKKIEKQISAKMVVEESRD